jgi:hypothetical protein
MSGRNRKPFQLSFTPRLDPEALKPYFTAFDQSDQPLTLEELQNGLAGIWRGLGAKGMISPEDAAFIIKSFHLVEDAKLTRLKCQNLELRNTKLAEELNLEAQTEPENEYKPEDKAANAGPQK